MKLQRILYLGLGSRGAAVVRRTRANSIADCPELAAASTYLVLEPSADGVCVLRVLSADEAAPPRPPCADPSLRPAHERFARDVQGLREGFNEALRTVASGDDVRRLVDERDDVEGLAVHVVADLGDPWAAGQLLDATYLMHEVFAAIRLDACVAYLFLPDATEGGGRPAATALQALHELEPFLDPDTAVLGQRGLAASPVVAPPAFTSCFLISAYDRANVYHPPEAHEGRLARFLVLDAWARFLPRLVSEQESRWGLQVPRERGRIAAYGSIGMTVLRYPVVEIRRALACLAVRAYFQHYADRTRLPAPVHPGRLAAELAERAVTAVAAEAPDPRSLLKQLDREMGPMAEGLAEDLRDLLAADARPFARHVHAVAFAEEAADRAAAAAAQRLRELRDRQRRSIAEAENAARAEIRARLAERMREDLHGAELVARACEQACDRVRDAGANAGPESLPIELVIARDSKRVQRAVRRFPRRRARMRLRALAGIVFVPWLLAAVADITLPGWTAALPLLALAHLGGVELWLAARRASVHASIGRFARDVQRQVEMHVEREPMPPVDDLRDRQAIFLAELGADARAAALRAERRRKRIETLAASFEERWKAALADIERVGAAEEELIPFPASLPAVFEQVTGHSPDDPGLADAMRRGGMPEPDRMDDLPGERQLLAIASRWLARCGARAVTPPAGLAFAHAMGDRFEESLKKRLEKTAVALQFRAQAVERDRLVEQSYIAVSSQKERRVFAAPWRNGHAGNGARRCAPEVLALGDPLAERFVLLRIQAGVPVHVVPSYEEMEKHHAAAGGAVALASRDWDAAVHGWSKRYMKLAPEVPSP